MDTVTLGISSSAVRWRRRRERARAIGLCSRCCTATPTENKRICDNCNTETKIRVAKMRARKKAQQTGHKRAARARMNETAGDELMDRHRSNWSRAVIRFERALGECTNVQDEQRLCEKIGYALAYGSRPELATPWYERSAKQHISRDRQRWFESRTKDALLEFDHMYEMLDLSHKYKPDFRNTIILQHARLYVLLGKYDEGERLHRSVESFAEKKGDDFTPVYRWIFHAARGHKKQAFDRFDRGPESASLLRGSGLAPGTWDEYANWAIELGRLDIAQVCRERSLFVARERRLGWHIPYCNLRLAELLLLSGNYNDARHFLTEA